MIFLNLKINIKNIIIINYFNFFNYILILFFHKTFFIIF